MTVFAPVVDQLTPTVHVPSVGVQEPSVPEPSERTTVPSVAERRPSPLETETVIETDWFRCAGFGVALTVSCVGFVPIDWA